MIAIMILGDGQLMIMTLPWWLYSCFEHIHMHAFDMSLNCFPWKLNGRFDLLIVLITHHVVLWGQSEWSWWPTDLCPCILSLSHLLPSESNLVTTTNDSIDPWILLILTFFSLGALCEAFLIQSLMTLMVSRLESSQRTQTTTRKVSIFWNLNLPPTILNQTHIKSHWIQWPSSLSPILCPQSYLSLSVSHSANTPVWFWTRRGCQLCNSDK